MSREKTQLLHLFLTQGKQNEMVEVLFKKYFEENKNIGDDAVLAKAAEEAGVSGASELLASDDLIDEVKKDIKRFQRDHGISGVPYCKCFDLRRLSPSVRFGLFPFLDALRHLCCRFLSELLDFYYLRFCCDNRLSGSIL